MLPVRLVHAREAAWSASSSGQDDFQALVGVQEGARGPELGVGRMKCSPLHVLPGGLGPQPTCSRYRCRRCGACHPESNSSAGTGCGERHMVGVLLKSVKP